MKPEMKMLMLTNERERDNRPNPRNADRRNTRPSSEMNMGYEGNAEVYGRRGRPRAEYEMRDRNENMNYGEMDGRFRNAGEHNYYGGEMQPSDNYEIEDRYYPESRGGRRYSRDRRGRFTPRNGYMDMDEDEEMEYIYGNEDYAEDNSPHMQIGFSTKEEAGGEYAARVEYPHMNEFEHRSAPAMMGYAMPQVPKKLSKEMAEKWMMGLQNGDGTQGPHWSLEQAKMIMMQRGIKEEPLDFWVILNSMYADYCKTFKKYGIGDKVEVYVDLTKDFLNDKDSIGGREKVAAYYSHIVKK